jgi:hypothetical protein
LFQFFQTRFHAAVVKVAADLDPQAADQRRVLAERNFRAGAVFFFPIRRHVRLQIGGNGVALSTRAARVPNPVSPAGAAATKFRRSRAVFCQTAAPRPAGRGFVQQTVHLATAEQLPGFALRLFGNFHLFG